EKLRFRGVVERAGVGHLAAGFGVDHGAVEDDFAALAGFQFWHLTALGDDGLDADIFSFGREVKVWLSLVRFCQLGVSGAGGFLGSPFPGSACASALLLHGPLKCVCIKSDAKIAYRIGNEIEWQSIRVIKPKSALTGVDRVLRIRCAGQG